MRAGLRVACLAAFVALLAAPAAGANTIHVTTPSDTVANDGACSLREAITASETGIPSGSAAGECQAGVGADTVVLAPVRYLLTLGELVVSGDVTITGSGAGSTAIDGSGSTDRVLDVQAAGVASLSGVTISGGHAPDGAAAADEAPGNPGQPGGGIRNDGVLSLRGDTVSGNHAGDGGAGGQSSSAKQRTGGDGGNGGGIYNAGTLTLADSIVSLNRAGDGGAGNQAVEATGDGGDGGLGGAIFSAPGAALTVTGTVLAANRAGDGGPGPSAASVAGSGGNGGRGGAIWTGGSLILTGTTIAGNIAGHGGRGADLSGGTPGGNGGMGADGGGVFDAASSSQTLSNDTITANSAGTGGDGGSATESGTTGGNAGSGGGGGGVVSGGAAPLILVNVTVASNLVGGPGTVGNGTAPGGPGQPGDPGTGGGISAYGAATLQNTIVANNTGVNCLGVTTDDGHNLSFPDNSTTINGDCAGVNANPRLGPLADNGGPTQTMALLPGSAAINAVPAAGSNCPATDQRGVTRPQGGACDIGAFEAAAPHNTARPVISGAERRGGTLTCSTGAWLNFPHSFAFAWRRGGLAIRAATRNSYRPTAADAGHALSCVVTATNQTGSVSATSKSVLIKVTAPRLAKLQISPISFRRHAEIAYTDSVAGAVTTFVVERRTRHGWVLVGSLTHRDRTGANRLRFVASIHGSPLPPGTYRLVATARLAGAASRPLTVAFQISR